MIKIKDTEYNIKYTLRALFIFEQITGKPFKVETLLDNYILYYSMILASNQDKVLDWNDFIDALDENPKLLLELNKAIKEQNNFDNIFNKEGDDSEKKINRF